MASIELQESLVARLVELAKSEGLSLEAYLARFAELRSRDSKAKPRLTGEELDQLLDGEASQNSAYQGSYPRADIYVDHE